MTPEQLADFCQAKPGAWPDNPWGHEHPVFRVAPGEQGKIFAFLGASGVGVKGGASREVADESYRLVVAKLPRKHRPEGWEA